MGTKLTDLTKKTFESDMIDNCFFVEKINTYSMSAIPLKSVFDYIIKKSKEEGLKVELKSDKIVFIKCAS